MRRLISVYGSIISIIYVLVLISIPCVSFAESWVIFTSGADARSLDPALHPGGLSDANIQIQLYDSLLYQDPDGTIRPCLATSWNYKNPTTVVFKLRQGVKFHDGTPFTAEAVKFSYERTLGMKRARWRHYIAMIKSIRVIDDYTIEFKLKYPFGPLLANLSLPVASIASPAAIKKYGKNFRYHPVGTGAFVLKELKAGEYIKLEANPNYWRGRPKIDKLEFRLVSEATTRVLQLRGGEVHLGMYLPPSQMEEVANDRKLDLVKVPLTRVIYVGLNNRIKPFDNVLVRRAVNYAIDTRAIVEKVMLGVGLPIRGPFGPASWAYDPEFEKMGYRHDPQKARDLLKQAGYPNGFETEFWHPSGRYTADKAAAEAMQAELAKVGIRVKLRTGGWGLVAPTIRHGKAPIYFYGWTLMSGDPDNLMFPKFHSSMIGRPGNFSGYADPEMDRLLEEARSALERTKRKAIYKKAVKKIIRDAPWLFFKQEVMLVGKSKKLKGVIFHPSERIYFYKAWLER